MNLNYIILSACILFLNPLSVFSQQKTFCNPLDVSYFYGSEIEGFRDHFPEVPNAARASADPVIINHTVKGKHEGYYLVSTRGLGYWKSKDLIKWEHVTPNIFPSSYSDSTFGGQRISAIAPAALSAKDTFFVMTSTYCPPFEILYSTDPASGHFEVYNKGLEFLNMKNPPPYWDPAMYYDDKDDRWYLYWGSSNIFPMLGAELDHSKRLEVKGLVRYLVSLYPNQHGWERFGPDHKEMGVDPYIEGAWMTKHNNKYYLQYGAPGTEYNMYANGTYVGDDPLGPFTYAPYNPVAYKPGGYAVSCGHGNTFKDKHGNYWNTGTSWIGVNWVFERRMVMLPAGFDADGQMYANARFADFPHYAPTKKMTDKNELFTGWMLLSYNKPVEASSTKLQDHPVENICDEYAHSFWVSETNNQNEWVIIDLEKEYDIKAFQINYADYLMSDTSLFRTIYEKETAYPDIVTYFKMYCSIDKKNWIKIGDNSADKMNRSNPYVELSKPVKGRYVKFENIHNPVPYLALNSIRVFGNGDMKLPATPENFTVERDPDDARNAFTSWQHVKDATGYNVFWGIAPDKLNLVYQVWSDKEPEKEIRALNLHQEYYFAIEAFNERGVSKLSQVRKIK